MVPAMVMGPDSSPANPPPSATSTAINVTAYSAAAAAIVVLVAGPAGPVIGGLAALLIVALIVGCGEFFLLRVSERPSAALSAYGAINLPRVGVKLLALVVTLAVVASLYALILPLAANRFRIILDLMPAGLILTALIAPAYFVLIDRRMDKPEDGYFEIGQLLLGRWHGRDWQAIRTYLLGWLIKAFFLPLMASSLFAVAANLGEAIEAGRFTTVGLFKLSFNVILFIDLAVATLGYICTIRLLDSHIRSCNPIWYGWIATVICYYPFWGIVYPGLLGYSSGEYWDDWFAGSPAVLFVWGSLILATKVMWIWANITFGLRFSNLTHRGILTNGPFRLTKHPSYIPKNIVWWLVSLPFLSTQGWQEALPNCIALLFINAIYFVRAKVEERHLSEDPVYVAYAAWIAEHGAVARFLRFVSAGRFTPASGQA